MQPIIEATISSCSSPAHQVEWGAGGWGGERGRGSGARMSALQSGCKETEQRSHPAFERGGDFGGEAEFTTF